MFIMILNKYASLSNRRIRKATTAIYRILFDPPHVSLSEATIYLIEARQKTLEKKSEQMLTAGIAKPKTATLESVVVFVPKRDDSVRFYGRCVCLN